MSDYRYMTTGERLGEAGLRVRWDQAIQSDDRPAMIAMLVSVDFTDREAQEIADSVRWNRFLDKQRKSLDAMSIDELGQLYSAMFGQTADMSIGVANLKELILMEIRLTIPFVCAEPIRLNNRLTTGGCGSR